MAVRLCAKYGQIAMLTLPPLVNLIFAVASGPAVVEAILAARGVGCAQPAPTGPHQLLAVTPLVGIWARVGAQFAHLAGLGAEAAHLAALVGPPELVSPISTGKCDN